MTEETKDIINITILFFNLQKRYTYLFTIVPKCYFARKYKQIQCTVKNIVLIFYKIVLNIRSNNKLCTLCLQITRYKSCYLVSITVTARLI